MKYVENSGSRALFFVLILTAVMLTLVGCGRTLDETSTERAVRYESVIKTNYHSMKSDIDVLLHMDKRSKLDNTIIREY